MTDASISASNSASTAQTDSSSGDSSATAPAEQFAKATSENDFAAARQVLADNPEQKDALLTKLSQSDPGAYYRVANDENIATTAPAQSSDLIASAPKPDSSWQRSVAGALDALNPVGKLQDFLQPQLANLTRSAGLGKTEWGASLQKVLDTPGSAAAFRQGVNEGLVRGAEDMVVGIASLAGKAVQYGADKSPIAGGGDALRGFTGKLPGWLDAAIPSAKRGEASDAAIQSAAKNVGGYISSRAQDPGLLTNDVKNAVGGMWNSIKGDHAKAAAQGPKEEARWWGQTIGRVTFEVAATVVPVAGQVGKVDKASDVAKTVANVIDDPWKGAARAVDAAPTPPVAPKKPIVPALMDSAASAASKITIKIQHVLTGEINKSGKAVGFHARPGGVNPPTARMTALTEAADVNGVYKGKVEIFDSAKGIWVPKKAQSSFFPDKLSSKQIENAVRNAYADALRTGNVNGASWTGKSGLGFEISGYVDGKTITSAFPIHVK
jgi:Bacterial EndoU nuclease